jgi:1-acyl-sn-glycerol-3-phosphate acyltransferase
MNQVKAIEERQTFLQGLSQIILSIFGWQIIGRFPFEDKYIVVGAPHTSNWDFVLMLLLRYATGTNLHFVGKASLFRWPFGFFMRRLGGIPVDRTSRNNFVEQVIELINRNDQLIIGITPEGTRGKTTYWRSGFYYMAIGAHVPILLVSIDYQQRQLEIGSLIYPSGDLQKDFSSMRKFYAGKRGKYPSKQGEIRLRLDGE